MTVPDNVTLSNADPITIQAAHSGDGLLSTNIINARTLNITQIDADKFEVSAIPSKKSPQTSTIIWTLAETASYYGAMQDTHITNNFGIPTTILMHFNDNLVDEAGNTWTTSAVEGTNYSYTTGKFGNGVQNSGNSPGLILTPSNAINLGGRDFTFAFWSRVLGANLSSYGMKISTATLELIFQQSIAGGTNFKIIDNGTMTEKGVVSEATGKIYHQAFVYQHSKQLLTIYTNGVKQAEFSIEIPAQQITSLEIGSYTPSIRTEVVDELYYSDGYAAWTADFTPPTQPY